MLYHRTLSDVKDFSLKVTMYVSYEFCPWLILSLVKLSNFKNHFSPLLSTKCFYKSIGSGREPTSFMTGKSVENTDEEGKLVSTRPVFVILVSIIPDPPVIPPEVSTRVVVKPPPCVPSVAIEVLISPPTDVPISPTTDVLELVPKSVPNPSRPRSLPAGLPGDVILRIVVFFVIVLDPPVPDPASDESAKPVPEDVLVTEFVLSNELLLLLLDSETLDIPSLATPPPSTVIEPLKFPSTLKIKYYNKKVSSLAKYQSLSLSKKSMFTHADCIIS